jgi:hypothetical protein
VIWVCSIGIYFGFRVSVFEFGGESYCDKTLQRATVVRYNQPILCMGVQLNENCTPKPYFPLLKRGIVLEGTAREEIENNG